MADTIGSVSSRDFSWGDLPTDNLEMRDHARQQADAHTYGFCAEPSSVIGGALCGDDTAVSNACRRASPDSVDLGSANESKSGEGSERRHWEIAKKAAMEGGHRALFRAPEVPK